MDYQGWLQIVAIAVVLTLHYIKTTQKVSRIEGQLTQLVGMEARLDKKIDDVEIRISQRVDRLDTEILLVKARVSK